MAELAVRRSLDTASCPDMKVAVRSVTKTSWKRRRIRVELTRGTSTLTADWVRRHILTGTVDLVVLSHPDQDHLPGFSSLPTSPTLIETERQRATLELLRDMYERASRHDWDGYGASPVRLESYELARLVVSLLPSNVPAPEVGADPDGELSFEWYRAPRHVFALSIGPDRRLSYAGLFGANKVNGVEYLQDQLPEPVLANLRRLFGGIS